MSRRLLAASAALVLTVTVTACGVGSDGDSSDTTVGKVTPTTVEGKQTTTTDGTKDEVDSSDTDELVQGAVDATMDVSSFTIRSSTKLNITAQKVTFDAKGSVDYDKTIADATLEAASSRDGEQKVRILADGSKLWVQSAAAGTLPDGKTWVEGDAARLAKSTSFDSSGLIGVVFALRAAEGTEEAGTDTIGGTETTKYHFETTYEKAEAAAGADRSAFTSALSLTSPTPVPLAIDVWLDGDQIVRRMRMTIGKGSAMVSGSYELDLSDVNEPVDAPDAPDAAKVLSGAQAEQILDQILKG